jgi:hypothetical protein
LEKYTVSIFRAPNLWYLPASQHGVTAQKTEIDKVKIVGAGRYFQSEIESNGHS